MALNCIFCHQCVVNTDNSKGHPVSVPPYGIAHSYCAEQDLLLKRIFKGIHITELDNESFQELKEMVLAEDNVRNGKTDEIDLF